MDDFSKNDLHEALQALTSLQNKCEKAQHSIAQGTPQWTLLKNRIRALHIAIALINQSLTEQ